MVEIYDHLAAVLCSCDHARAHYQWPNATWHLLKFTHTHHACLNIYTCIAGRKRKAQGPQPGGACAEPASIPAARRRPTPPPPPRAPRTSAAYYHAAGGRPAVPTSPNHARHPRPRPGQLTRAARPWPWSRSTHTRAPTPYIHPTPSSLSPVRSAPHSCAAQKLQSPHDGCGTSQRQQRLLIGPSSGGRTDRRAGSSSMGTPLT